MKHIKFLNYLVFISCSLLVIGQSAAEKSDDILSSKSRAVEQAYVLLVQDEENIKNKLNYIHVFPKNSSDFKDIFSQRDFSELYRGSHKYIFILTKLSRTCPEEVGALLVNLGRDMVWEADAVNYLQRTLAKYASDYTEKFAAITRKQLNRGDAHNLIRFIADVENFKYHEDYDKIISNLQKIGEKDLAQKFIDARKARKKKKYTKE